MCTLVLISAKVEKVGNNLNDVRGFKSTPTSTCMKGEHQKTDRGKVGLLEVGTRGDQRGFGGQ